MVRSNSTLMASDQDHHLRLDHNNNDELLTCLETIEKEFLVLREVFTINPISRQNFSYLICHYEFSSNLFEIFNYPQML
jgi:hypothetical protein